MFYSKNKMENIQAKKTLLNISKQITLLMNNAIRKTFPLPDFNSTVTWNSTGSSDLCCPSAMKIYNMNNKKDTFTLKNSKEVAEEILKNFEKHEMIGEILITQQVTGAPKEKEKEKEKENANSNPNPKANKKPSPVIENFFIDINLDSDWVSISAMNILRNGVSIDTEYTNRKVLVDFSSPNIAKEMHVGHLRSTIIGDSTCRILEFLGNEVMRINHIGDWGTQFGMLIAHLEDTCPNYLVEQPDIGDLESFYKAAKGRFNSDPDFVKRAQLKTVDLQTGNENVRKAWQFICQLSRNEFNKIYERLDIKLEEYGESFYDPFCRVLVKDLEEKGLAVLDQGAKVLKVPGFKIPYMLVKSDGGLTYDTTDLTALSYRLNELKRDWIIYCIGSEQELHMKLLFKGGELCGWVDPEKTRLDHMGFGLMLSAEGKKMATSDGNNIKLVCLLDEAKSRALNEIKSRAEETKMKWDDAYLDLASSNLGYSAVKYFDLKQSRMTQYKFDYSLMLDPRGNTAVYLFYNYVRILSILRKLNISDSDMENLIKTKEIKITEKKEKLLLVQLIKLNDVIDDVLTDLALNKLCDYVYNVAVKFSEFYEECKIAGTEQQDSRILILELTKRMLKLSFDLLGLKPIEKI
jgi:arginyl-tRNA synthetase